MSFISTKFLTTLQLILLLFIFLKCTLLTHWSTWYSPPWPKIPPPVVYRKVCLRFLVFVISVANSLGLPVILGFFRGSALCSPTMTPLPAKFSSISSKFSFWFKRIWILPLPVQIPFMLSSSRATEMTCLAPDIFLISILSELAGKLRSWRSTTRISPGS